MYTILRLGYILKLNNKSYTLKYHTNKPKTCLKVHYEKKPIIIMILTPTTAHEPSTTVQSMLDNG